MKKFSFVDAGIIVICFLLAILLYGMMSLIINRQMWKPITYLWYSENQYSVEMGENFDEVNGMFGLPIVEAVSQGNQVISLRYLSTFTFRINNTKHTRVPGFVTVSFNASKNDKVTIVEGRAWISCLSEECSIKVQPTLLGWLILTIPAFSVFTCVTYKFLRTSSEK
ncbi:hypothetical protein GYA37_01800 [candidate division WWE3 bacterium]|uniref:Uncharacterized protein n=1 Tax=candidate division WWE3 bacterium TaxID=2053526 RepID=A0A7X9E6Z4_UNCKA|nr:hypothetical protein [candidate division WWE3 bacterium]